MCNGGTVRYLIQYLTPCRKVHTTFVMLHGALSSPNYAEQMQENMARCIPAVTQPCLTH